MLTITAPIRTVLRNDLCRSNEAFGRRIQANYDQLSEAVDREDLMHLVTQPPEIFLVEGEGGSFLSETQIRNTQMKKVEIINNLMNRILVSADAHLTYQDEVYITNVLHKLGIRDERTFMKKAYELFEETKQNNRLIETYWQNRTELTQMIAFYRMQNREGDTTENVQNEEEILHLHEDVFKRWMTAAVYRIQNNFRSTVDSSTYVEADSYRMTEEQRLSQQILLQRLRESVRGEEVPLVYRHENYYEMPQITEELPDSERIAEQIASAVLLSLADNLYENYSSNNTRMGDRYYHTENAFYGAADHVFERMEGNTAYLISQHRAGDVTQQMTENSRFENNVIHEILNEYYGTIDARVGEQLMADIAEELTYLEPRETEAEREEQPGTEIHVDTRNTLEQQLYQTNLLNEQRRKTYIENLRRLSERVTEAEGGRPDEGSRLAESNFAFAHPEEFKRQYEEEAARREEKLEEGVESYIENLPQRTREVLTVIETYLKNPSADLGPYRVTRDNENLLFYDVFMTERQERLLHEQQTMEQVLEQSTETNRTRERRLQTVEENVGRLTPETVRLVHKVNDVTVDEETIENLRREIRRVENETQKTREVVDNKETVTTQQVNNINETFINEQNEDAITAMIQNNINMQIGNITNKVYNRLERQLQSERRRRGM